jgi:eukaryotic-like serine/threonine-protein kinase
MGAQSQPELVVLEVPPAPPSSEVIEIEDYIVDTAPPRSVDLAEPAPPAEASARPVDVLAREEAARTRGFARALMILCAFGVTTQVFLDADLWLRAVMTVTLLVVGATSFWTWRLAADPPLYTADAARVFATVAAGAAILVPYCLGVFSPAPIVVILGITFFGLGKDRLSAIGLPIVVASGYALMAGLIILGVLPDAGLMKATTLPQNVQLVMAVTVPLVYLLALWQARLSRGATVEAVGRSHVIAREVALQEKQLDKVNHDLDRLLSMGAGDPGAFTGDVCGPYVLGKLVGRGAMAEVYSATHAKSGEVAAVKLLQSGMAADSHIVLRFLREGEAASKLRAPNVVSIYQVGKTADGLPYIAMELLRGHDLGWHLRQRTRMPLDEVVGIVEQVAAGLEAARRAGIVHRDLKPQNLFLAQQERAAPVWKILDFGVSRFTGSSGTLTQDMVVGTPAYMSPEQAAGVDATHRSDVFSFGALVYRALTGVLPFDGPDTPQVLYQVVYKNPARPSEICPSLPPDVDLVLAIALAKDIEDRFASGLEFAEALRDAARGKLLPSVRLHGQTVLAGLPWGTSVRGSAAPDGASIEINLEG